MKITPLGGLGEIGLNSMLFEDGDDAVLIDAGVMFGHDELPGIGAVLPDFELIRSRAKTLRAVVLTHGHEDHVGAIAELLKVTRVPVYGTPFTLSLVRHKLEEAGVEGELREMAPRERFEAGAISIEPLRVCHSIPDACGVVLRGPSATCIHSGDFKLDDAPPDGRVTDLERIAQLGEEGVSCLLADSTNSEVLHETGSERGVGERLDALIGSAPGRVIVSMFASNWQRIETVARACEKHGRKIVLLGRGMVRNSELMRALGRFEWSGLVAPLDAASSLPAREICLLATGAQGEVRSGLTQLLAEDRDLRISAGDTVILSARAIPGNERAVGRIIDQCLAHGARVVHAGNDPAVHVSGHASPGQQRRLIELARPRAFVPIHGERRQLVAHLATAASLLPASALLPAHDGDVLEIDASGGRKLGTIAAGRRYRDWFGNGFVPLERVQERRRLAETGAVCIALVLEGASLEPRLPVTLGVGLATEEDALLVAAAEAAREAIRALSPPLRADEALIREETVMAVRRVFKHATGKRPAVLPTVVKL